MPKQPFASRLKLPRTRTGAAAVVAGLVILGFGLGAMLLVVVPLVRSGQGPLAWLAPRQSRVPVDSRVFGQFRPPPTPQSLRPELWLTPVGTFAFPSEQHFADLRDSGRAVSATAQPGRNQQVLSLPPISDATGRSLVVPLIAFSTENAMPTPDPARPSPAEPTQITIAATRTGSQAVAGCVLALQGEVLRAVVSMGSAVLEECQNGVVRLGEAEGSLIFALEYEPLPNFQSRSGAWFTGGVLGRTRVLATLS